MSKKVKREILNKWAKPKESSFSFDLIVEYSNYNTNIDTSQLDEKTVIDLDFDNFFSFVDRTNSAVGQQYLYSQLLQQNRPSDELKAQEELVGFYHSNPEKKMDSAVILKGLSKPNDYYFPYLLFSELPSRLYNPLLIKLLQICTVLSIALAFKFPMAILFLVILFAVNLFLHYVHKGKIGNFTVYFSRLTSLSATVRKLLPFTNHKETKKVNILADAKHIDKITSQVLFLKTDRLQNSEFGAVLWLLFEIIKIITLSEITVFNKLVDKIRSARPQIHNVYKAIGEIDVAISICSLRDGLPYFSIPHFSISKKSLEVKDLYHPLVSDCVANDIALVDKSLLLTGSNMAGKSTFIKAVNLNAISSQILNTSFSTAYTAPIWYFKTSMTIKDNLEESSSYYMEEVSSIGELIKYSDDIEKQYLFTIDEIFKGTNTIERISTAKAILEYINRNNHLVLVSTHDIELTKLLQHGFDLYFFQESIADKALAFDYKLKKGTLEKSNAIKILEIAGYPITITDEAKRLAERIKDEKTG